MLVLRRVLAIGILALGLYLAVEAAVAGSIALWIWTGWRWLEPNWPAIAYGIGIFLMGLGLVFAAACLWTGRIPPWPGRMEPRP